MLGTSVLLALLAATQAWAQSSTVDSYIATESPIAKAGILGMLQLLYTSSSFCVNPNYTANIGPDGSKDQGAKSGIVIASPS
jgi:glucoamylase